MEQLLFQAFQRAQGRLGEDENNQKPPADRNAFRIMNQAYQIAKHPFSHCLDEREASLRLCYTSFQKHWPENWHSELRDDHIAFLKLAVEAVDFFKNEDTTASMLIEKLEEVRTYNFQLKCTETRVRSLTAWFVEYIAFDYLQEKAKVSGGDQAKRIKVIE
jgi:hypothetical protein